MKIDTKSAVLYLLKKEYEREEFQKDITLTYISFDEWIEQKGLKNE